MNEFAEILNLFIANVIAYTFFVAVYSFIIYNVGKIILYLMGFTVVPFGQGFKDMSPPTKELMKLTLEQKLAHGGHPVLRWMMDNIYIRTDPAGNIKADKEKSTEKIDGAVATIMGLDRAIRCGNNTGASVYDDRGILFI